MDLDSVDESTAAVTCLLTPGRDLDWFAGLRAKHAEADREQLLEWASARLRTAEVQALHTHLQRDLASLLAVPGCAGLHLPESHPDRERNLLAFIVELAAEGGWSFTTECANRGAITLPLSGVRITGPASPSSITCTAETGTIGVVWDSRCVVLGRDQLATASGDVMGSDRLRGLRFDSPATQDFGLGAPQANVRPPAPLTPHEREHVEAALSFLGLADEGLMDELRTSQTCLVGLLSRPDLARQSYSVEALPRIVYCAIDDPFELCDVICHEYHHLKLFLVEESHPLLANPREPAIAPWRKDIRAARGVLHGLYVFFVLANVVGGLFRMFTPTVAGLRKVIMWRTVVDKGVDCLRRTDWQPTELGAQLLSEIEFRNGERLAELEREDPALAAWVGELVDEHVRRLSNGEQSEPHYTGF